MYMCDAVYNLHVPIFETEVKGGSYSVTLHLHRRVLAGAIARGLSLHKRSQLHFGQGSRVEAARVAEDAKNHYESGGCSDGDGFSARQSSREHGFSPSPVIAKPSIFLFLLKSEP